MGLLGLAATFMRFCLRQQPSDSQVDPASRRCFAPLDLMGSGAGLRVRIGGAGLRLELEPTRRGGGSGTRSRGGAKRDREEERLASWESVDTS